jgi:hypothetical protein
MCSDLSLSGPPYGEGQALAAYLKGRNKADFARRCGFAEAQRIYHYLPRKNGKGPLRRMSRDVAERIVAASHGALSFNDLFGYEPPHAEKAA